MNTRRIFAWTTVVAMITSSVAVPASAQRPIDGLPDSVPRALAEALAAQSLQMVDMMMRGDGGRPRLIVGSPPAGLAHRVWVPPGAVVLGGLEASGIGVAFLRSTFSVDSLTAAYRREQRSLGWTGSSTYHLGPVWGFLPASPPRAEPRSESSERLQFCSGDTLLTIHIAPVAAGVREISAGSTAMGAGVCRAPATEADLWRAMRYSYHPTLTNPPETGAGRWVDCADWSMSQGGGETRLGTALSVEEVLAHYGAQLADSGWTVAVADEIVSRTWTRRDSTGAFVDLTLSARRRPRVPHCVDVEMRVNTRTVR